MAKKRKSVFWNINTMTKKQKISKHVKDMLALSQKSMIENIDIILNSGCIDIESWDEKNSPMIIPKCIVAALLDKESHQYLAKGTCFEKQIKKEVRNIRYFI